MYYRVAIQVEAGPTWQWRSTVLTELSTLFHFLRLFGGLKLEQLRVFSSPTREGFQEQLAQENRGGTSPSVTAADFLHERRIQFPPGSEATPPRRSGARQPMAAIAEALQSFVNASGGHAHDLPAWSMNSLERRRLELELGPGGDHDVPYQFALPAAMPQVLAWMRVLARIQRGAVSP